MNAATKRLTGAIEGLRRVHLQHPPFAHHRDALAEGHRLDLVMRDIDRRRPEPGVQRRELARMLTRSFASRFESGSSIRNAFGSRTIARPIATRWRWPPESAPGRRWSSSSRPSSFATSATRFSISGFRCAAPSGRSRGSRARSCAGRARSSGRPSRCLARAAAARSRRARRSGSRRRSPPRGRRSSAGGSTCRTDGPTRTRNSPESIASETSSTATTSAGERLRDTCSSTISPTRWIYTGPSLESAMALTNFVRSGIVATPWRPSDPSA